MQGKRSLDGWRRRFRGGNIVVAQTLTQKIDAPIIGGVDGEGGGRLGLAAHFQLVD